MSSNVGLTSPAHWSPRSLELGCLATFDDWEMDTFLLPVVADKHSNGNTFVLSVTWLSWSFFPLLWAPLKDTLACIFSKDTLACIFTNYPLCFVCLKLDNLKYLPSNERRACALSVLGITAFLGYSSLRPVIEEGPAPAPARSGLRSGWG